MSNEQNREPPFPGEINKGYRLMEYRSKAFEHNNLNAFLSLLRDRGNGSGWKTFVDFHPDQWMDDGRAYFTLDLEHNGIKLAILSDLTFAEFHSKTDVRPIDASTAIDIYSERKIIWAIGERMRMALREAEMIYGSVDLPPEIPESLKPVG